MSQSPSVRRRDAAGPEGVDGRSAAAPEKGSGAAETVLSHGVLRRRTLGKARVCNESIIIVIDESGNNDDVTSRATAGSGPGSGRESGGAGGGGEGEGPESVEPSPSRKRLRSC